MPSASYLPLGKFERRRMRDGFLSELGDQTRVVILRSQETTMADDLTNRGAG
jgi:hypothetical protein